MTKKTEKYRSIGTLEEKDQVFKDYLSDPVIAKISRKYQLPYSTLRRFLLEELETHAMSGALRVEYLNVDDFPFLREGYTFQYDERFTIWNVVGITSKESDKVFVLIPTPNRGQRHYICDKEVA